jgi:hypothetical protein
MMPDIFSLNFEYIKAHYYERTSASQAAAWIETQRESIPPEPAISFDRRDMVIPPPKGLGLAFYELTRFYALIEVAVRARFLPERLPDEFVEKAIIHLSHRPLQQLAEALTSPFFHRDEEDEFRYSLPGHLLRHLQGDSRYWSPGDRDQDQDVPLFMQFLEVNALIENSEEVAVFTTLMSGGQVRDVQIADTLQALKNERRFVIALLKPERLRNAVDRSILGFWEFLHFCAELEALLEYRRQSEITQAIWAYHAYWFANDRIADVMRTALEKVGRWHTFPEPVWMTPEGPRSDPHESLHVVERLLSIARQNNLG